MKRLLLVAILALVVGGSASAATARWVPGNPYYISEKDAYELLEKTYDSAYCSGVARFGKRGEFPYEEYLYFDCTVRMSGPDGYSCIDNRYRAIKGSRQWYYRLKLVRRGDCF